MRCKTVEDRITAFLDNELTWWNAARVRWHLKGCPSCAAELQALRALNETLRDATLFGAEESPFLPATNRRRMVAPVLTAAIVCGIATVFLIPMGRQPVTPANVANPVTVSANQIPVRNSSVSSVPSKPRPAPIAAVAAALKPAIAKPIAVKPSRRVPFAAKKARVRQTPSTNPRRTWVRRAVEPRQPQPKLSPRLAPVENDRSVIIIAACLPTEEEMIQQANEAAEFLYIEAKPIPLATGDALPQANPSAISDSQIETNHEK
jgi:hypothetical protein